MIEINRNGSRPSTRGPAQNFAGSVIVDPLFGATEHTHATGGLVTFEPGARTAWHTHPAGQTLIVTSSARGPRPALVVAVLGFFVVTLDALVVNVALPSIGSDLGGGIAGLQWVVDGYTLMFAALLLSAGALSDRIGARHAFGVGLATFVAASAACGLAPQLGALVLARLAQGAGAAVMLPASLALIREAYSNARQRARAIAIWSLGAAVASSAGPVVGGFLTLLSWRMIFFINLPVGLVALYLLLRVARSPRRPAPFDWVGQVTAILGMGALTYGLIEGGAEASAHPTSWLCWRWRC